MNKVIINSENNNIRIDLALASLTNHSRSMIQKLIKKGKIKKDSQIVERYHIKVLEGEEFEIDELPVASENIIPQKGDLEIIFEDDYIIVLNKEAGLCVHPGAGQADNTLANRLAAYSTLSDINGMDRMGIVHRLDKPVSGCMVIAKTNEVHLNLAQQFQDRLVQKEYVAICYNTAETTSGTMEDKIGRCSRNRKKMACTKNGKESYMDYEVLEQTYIDHKIGFISKIKCKPKTGRMHQIRVQLSTRKLPIIGDEVYGRKKTEELKALMGESIALHSNKLSFEHPVSKEQVHFGANIPDLFDLIPNALKTIKK